MLLHDLSFAVRTLRRSPVFTLAAVLTIALGIGASTAIFSVTNAVLLRPLPYTDPDRLVVMYMDLRARHTFGMPLSNENYADIRNGSTGVFEDMAAVRTVRQVLPGADGTPEEIRLALVTTNFFRLMGAQVAVGRDFLDSDGLPQPLAAAAAAPDVQAPPPAVAILSHAYWLRRYGGDPKVLGQRIPGGPRPEIIGVLAPGLELMFPSGANVEQRPDCWVANRLSYDNANRNTFGLRPIGRLKPGVTLARAQEQVESVAAKLRQDFPLQTTAGFYARLEPMHDTLVEEVRPAILALTGAVTFLFLIACANVANLLLVRAWAREGEFAVRAALGAGRWRTVRQMLADAFVLTGLGACAGVPADSLADSPPLPEPEWVEIIGVVAHQRVASLADPGREQVYFADGFTGGSANKWAMRVSGNPGSYGSAVRAAIAQVDPQFLITELQPMDDLVRRAQAGTRFTLILIAIFATMAAMLVGVGLYGVLAMVVRQRTAELGVRMALGASPSTILRLVVGHGLGLSAAGLAVGLAAAFVLTQGMTTMLVGVKPTDPLTFAVMVAVFLVIAVVSSWLPARRAAGLNPTSALRDS